MNNAETIKQLLVSNPDAKMQYQSILESINQVDAESADSSTKTPDTTAKTPATKSDAPCRQKARARCQIHQYTQPHSTCTYVVTVII